MENLETAVAVLSERLKYIEKRLEDLEKIEELVNSNDVQLKKVSLTFTTIRNGLVFIVGAITISIINGVFDKLKGIL